ncbi:MAG: hypothetical protein KJO21_04660 [Verrucomicrobiae bacterium]|nr:hypothetical protein [Verrucomicrobiae bacterium]NNJ43015.1 hypothetical protein [Akkermansiaceae bacterium]
MKSLIRPAILTAQIFCICALSADPAKLPNNADVWPMFKQAEVVDLTTVKIPEGYKRDKITDIKGRVIAGEWLVIDRGAETVKFRKQSDGKEYVIPFAQLSEHDLAYARLENGIIWDTGEKPLVPLNLFRQEVMPRSFINVAPGTQYLGADGKIAKAELVGKDMLRVPDKSNRLTYLSPVTKDSPTIDLPLAMLTEHDRNLIKEHTGLEVPVVRRPAWIYENRNYWEHTEKTGKKTPDGQDIYSRIMYPIFDRQLFPLPFKNTITKKDGSLIKADHIYLTRGNVHVLEEGKETLYLQLDDLSMKDRQHAIETISKLRQSIYKFNPAELITRKVSAPKSRPRNRFYKKETLFDLALNQFLKAYTAEEIFNHLQVRTLNTAFIHEYLDWKSNNEEPASKIFDAKHIRNIAEIMPQLGVEPQTESISLKQRIDKTGLKPYEEKAPNKPLGQEKKQGHGQPIDGKMQAYHFVAQYIGMSKGRPKVRYLDFLRESLESNSQTYQIRPGFYSYDWHGRPLEAVKKSHQAKYWQADPVISIFYNDRYNFRDYLNERITRQFLRTNKPVVIHLKNPGVFGTPPDAQEGHAIVTGFSRKHGKTTYEAIIINGPAYLGSKLYPPFRVSYKESIKPEYFRWEQVIFIE